MKAKETDVPMQKFYRKKKRRKESRKERETGRIGCKVKTKYIFWKKIPPGTEENIR